MKKYIEFGNILDVQEGIIIHGCNSFGIFGSGIALQIKEKYPEAYEDYRFHVTHAKKEGEDPLGCVYAYRVNDNLRILNAITQSGFGRERGKRYVDYRAIKRVFAVTAVLAEHWNLEVNYPMVGAGLGGGDWSIISEIIDVELANVTRTLWIYEP